MACPAPRPSSIATTAGWPWRTANVSSVSPFGEHACGGASNRLMTGARADQYDVTALVRAGADNVIGISQRQVA